MRPHYPASGIFLPRRLQLVLEGLLEFLHFTSLEELIDDLGDTLTNTLNLLGSLGKGIAKIINEYLETGKVKKLEKQSLFLSSSD